MANIYSLLLHIEREAGLSRRESVPLYAYRVSDSALDKLRVHLERVIRSGRTLEIFDCAGFCLFAAEHFCRTHESGAWKWQPVLDAVGYERGPQELYRVITRGLQFWGRPLLTAGSHRGFLITLACEGGLPRKVLHHEEQRLTRYLRALLGERERFTQTPIRMLAERHANALPQTLHNETVFELCGRLIEQIARLRQLVGESDDPAAVLEQCEPGWRQTLPLRLDDDVAERLLGGLLRSPRPAAEHIREPIRVEVSLRETPLRITRRVRLPPEIDATVMAEMLQTDENALPARMQLHVHGVDGARQAIANATRFDASYRLVPLRRRSVELEGLARLTLVATVGPREIGRGDLEGGDELSGEQPLTFTDDEGGVHRLLGVGSFRTRREHVRALLPMKSVLEPEDHAAVQPLGDLTAPAGRLVQLNGALRLEVENDVYRIVTRALAETGRRFLLRGSHSPLTVGGSEVWRGLPRVFQVVGEDPPKEVPHAWVEWRPTHVHGPWTGVVDDRALGEVVVRVVENGETCFRTRLIVVPKAFVCRLLPGAEPRTGLIRLENTGAIDINVQVPAGVTHEVSRPAQSHFDVNLASGTIPPAQIFCDLLFENGGTARLSVPFPSAVPEFLDRAGRQLGDDAEVPLSRMVGAHAVIHAPRPRSKFRLRGRLNLGGPGWVDLADMTSVEGESVALSLDLVHELVESMLASTDALDAYVDLRIVELGAARTGRPVQIRVGRYDAPLNREDLADRSGVTLFLNDAAMTALGPNQVADLCIEARPIHDPSKEAEVLSAVAAGRWLFPTHARATGGWLLTGRIGPVMRLRPLLITVRPEENAVAVVRNEPRSALVTAIEVPKRAERKSALHGLAEALGQDFAHPDWPGIMGYLESVQALPASTFDPIKALARVPDASVRALFMVGPEQFDAVWDGLEELPFLWKLVSVKSWLHAVRDYRSYVVGLIGGDGASGLDPTRLVGERVQRLLEQGVRRSLHLGWLTFVLGQVLDDELPGLEPTPPACDRNAARESLLRRPGHWPEWDIDPLLDEYGVPVELRDSDPIRYRFGVLNAPVLAAMIAVDGRMVDDHVIFQLRRSRTFDENWFEHAHAEAFMHLLNMRITENPEFLR